MNGPISMKPNLIKLLACNGQILNDVCAPSLDSVNPNQMRISTYNYLILDAPYFPYTIMNFSLPNYIC